MIKQLLKKSVCLVTIVMTVLFIGTIVASAKSQYCEMYSSNNKHGWVHDNIYYPAYGYNVQSWNYYDENGNPKDGWFKVNGKWYYGDEMHEDCYCGIYIDSWAPEYYKSYVDNNNVWHDDFGQFNYYCGSDGAVKTGWFKAYKYNDSEHKQGLKWFYAGSNGKIYRSSYTPDGYWVDSDGVCS